MPTDNSTIDAPARAVKQQDKQEFANRADKRGAHKDRNRRRRFLSAAQNALKRGLISRGCRAWLDCLAERSNDYAKPVWGKQTGQAEEVQCTDRTIRTYRKEAEDAGLICTRRALPERNPDGSWGRAHTNMYSFCVPPGKPKRKNPSSSRPESDCRNKPHPTDVEKTLRDNHSLIVEDDPPDDGVRSNWALNALRSRPWMR